MIDSEYSRQRAAIAMKQEEQEAQSKTKLELNQRRKERRKRLSFIMEILRTVAAMTAATFLILTHWK